MVIRPLSPLDDRREGWISFRSKTDIRTLVIEKNGERIGTSSFGKSRYPEFAGAGEIISIYLLPEFMGGAMGSRCWTRLPTRLPG